MALAAPFKAKIPTWPEDMSRNCSPWRTAQLILEINTVISLGQTPLVGIDSWYAREKEAFAAANPSTAGEDKMSSPCWEEAGMAALGAQGYGQARDSLRARASSPFLKHFEGVFISRPLSNMPDKVCQDKGLF